MITVLKDKYFMHWRIHSKKDPRLLERSLILRTASRFFSNLRDPLANLYAMLFPWVVYLLTPALLFSILFVPRFPVATVRSFYQVDLKLEDLFLVAVALVVLCGLFAKFLRHSIRLAQGSAVETFFLAFLIACQLSILSGIYLRTIDKPLVSLLYLGKWMEYFLAFIIGLRLCADEKTGRFFLQVFFFLGLAVALYGYWEHFSPAAKAVYPNYYRLYERAPFHGDANHMGGFLVFWFAVFLGIFLKSDKPMQQKIILLALLFVFFPLIWTYSRKSYFALVAILGAAFFIPASKRRVILMVCLVMLLGLLLPTRLSERLLDLGETFTATDPFHSSWAGNVDVWKNSLWNFDRFFLLGSGLGSRHRLYYESQYVLVLAETGLIGIFAFALLLLAPLREFLKALSGRLSVEGKGLAFGWILGLVGLAVHNISCVSLTVSKVAIPFWWLTGVLIALVRFDVKPKAEI